MKITVPVDNLSDAMSSIEKVTARGLKLPILSGVLLEAKKDRLTLRATNLELGMELSVKADSSQDGAVVLPAQTFSSILNTVSETSITLVGSDSSIQITTPTSTTSLNVLPISEFPSIPQINGTHFTLNADQFAKGLKAVAGSASVSNIKTELQSVCVYGADNHIVFVATDSFRLSEYKIPFTEEFPSILIPLKNIQSITRFLEGGGEVTVTLNENQIAFSKHGDYLTSRLLNGVFPDYQQIIPKESLTTATLLREDFLAALRLMSVFSGNFHQVRFSIDPKKKKISVTSKSEVGEGSEVLKGEMSGEAIELSFNHRYLVDGLNTFSGESVTLHLHGAGRPVIMRAAKESALYLVMPMNR